MSEKHDPGDRKAVGDLGEHEVLRRVLAQLAPAGASLVGPGDDSAVVRLGGDLVVTSDMMIEGPDFRLAWHRGFDLGWKLAATNLSDVASMGATPIGLTVALACPRDTSVELLEEVSRGLTAACAELAPGCGVVGGDLSTAPVLSIAVTAFGDMRGRTPVLRSGARPGDAIAYAGQLGLSGIGLALLFREAADEHGTALAEPVDALRTRYPTAIAAQFAPNPPILAGVDAAVAGASAMMDVSDGLSLDAARMAKASGVALVFNSEQLKDAFGVQGEQTVSIEAMMIGGEDHGMLATFPPDAPLPAGFAVIGEVRTAAGEVSASRGSNVFLDGEPFIPRGWDPYGVLPPGA